MKQLILSVLTVAVLEGAAIATVVQFTTEEGYTAGSQLDDHTPSIPARWARW